ncbi:ribonuclease HII [Campylobacter subantarcticus LMG 24377]|uniref:Ribonuclease n=2 Tax=Campylobacter subantarcticus TaxID=497724 RepID=A0A0A8H8N8_9BACT|nr:ribonuclease HII [Campylobacter subantarcticus]EAJ1260820.1 ribonuclease HII [Campylobacter lari]AJC89995.1 ribonuclease HII [Campylobacter subantarcticus LMG 24374]AJC91662.1 ribonuclease HII [Campylobacter subantarcticus LMG 24377]EAL3939056.1 ribonuclease HII [Campylobacter lari]MPB98892.1 ribonuclease HII [Campylobacter subantarcticus]
MALVGVDEAGRGALAGDMHLSACKLFGDIDGLTDSKKLSAKKREELYGQILAHSNFLILAFSPLQIDTLGLSQCLQLGLKIIKKHFSEDDILYDGNLNYGVVGVKTMIKADMKVQEVSAASILAKVSRDQKMRYFSKLYNNYDFDKHKGYGTKTHIEKIKVFGYSPLHRKSFMLKCFEKSLFD